MWDYRHGFPYCLMCILLPKYFPKLKINFLRIKSVLHNDIFMIRSLSHYDTQLVHLQNKHPHQFFTSNSKN